MSDMNEPQIAGSAPETSGKQPAASVPETVGSFADAIGVQAKVKARKGDIQHDAPETINHEAAPITYFYDEGIPGAGDRPEYLLDNFKTIAAQAKAYKDAQKIIGKVKSIEGIIGAPESYRLPDDVAKFDLANKYTDLLKKHGLNQKFLDSSLEVLREAQSLRQSNMREEMKRLGDNAEDRISTVKQWVLNNFDEDTVQAFRHVPMKAEVIKMLERVKSMSTQNQVPGSGATPSGSQGESLESIRAEMMQNRDKIKTNEEYAKQIMERMARAGGTLIRPTGGSAFRR